ncbi:hypothetical protein L1887_14831 [Cichorium endivia]|nr:hypothetical protein L1887_14831 [Cichorium endivia]
MLGREDSDPNDPEEFTAEQHLNEQAEPTDKSQFDSALVMGLMFHGKTKRLVKNRKCEDAVKVPALGEYVIPRSLRLGAGGKEAVATFEGIAILTPRLVIPLDLAVIGNQFHSNLGLLDTSIGMW